MSVVCVCVCAGALKVKQLIDFSDYSSFDVSAFAKIYF